jgi:hypothetical protein
MLRRRPGHHEEALTSSAEDQNVKGLLLRHSEDFRITSGAGTNYPNSFLKILVYQRGQ